MMKVFYLENEEMIAKMMERVFTEKGEEIYHRDTLGDWKYLLGDLAPDLVLADFRSMEVSDEVSWDDLFSSQIPVAVIIPEDQHEGVEKVKGRAPVLIIEKPFSPFELFDTIMEWRKKKSS